MAKDVGRVIWELAKADKTLDGLELQAMYKKKIKIDSDAQREKLKEIVSEFIKNNYQPVQSKMKLTDDLIIGGRTKGNKTYKIRPNRGAALSPQQIAELETNIYAYKASDFDYVEVTVRESKNLIKYAIIPLNLNWELESCGNYYSNFIISWNHWPEN